MMLQQKLKPNEADERLGYIALARTTGIGARRLAALLSRFHSPLGVLRTPFALLGPDELSIRPLLAHPDRALAEAARYVEEVASLGMTLLTPADPTFPAMLRSIPEPPVLLYARGDVELLSQPAVAIVGSRAHTSYGQEVARALAAAAANAGLVVVSGMARGLDAVAHQAALDVAGKTIGVLGCGIGFIYPAANARLYQAVEDRGLLLTENPPGMAPTNGAFPRRNRLISGLAQVLVVIEAAQRSGTMLTVTSALEQGRTVMAVPGPITAATSTGTNQLLRDGAEPVLGPDDLLRHFNLVAAPTTTAEASPARRAPPCTLSAEEARVFDALTVQERHIDALTLMVGLPVGTMLGVLCGLELGGLVEQLPGGWFRRGGEGR